MNLRETIKETTRNHLKSGNLLMGQCVTAVGWVNGTIPNEEGIVEFPCTDISGAGFACGAALAGDRPFLIIRFQDFLLLNGSPLLNFAAKQKDIWKKECPVFVRCLNQEGGGTGPTHSAKLHSLVMHYPGTRVHSPITSNEWLQCYHTFMSNNDPMFCMEYKSTFDNNEEYLDIVYDKADFTLIGIGLARLNMMKAAEILEKEGIRCNIVHIHKLKPFDWKPSLIESILSTGNGLVIDCGFDICGAGSWIAQKLGEQTEVLVHSLGLEDKSVGVCKENENPTPTVEKIVNKVKEIFL